MLNNEYIVKFNDGKLIAIISNFYEDFDSNIKVSIIDLIFNNLNLSIKFESDFYIDAINVSDRIINNDVNYNNINQEEFITWLARDMISDYGSNIRFYRHNQGD